MEEKKPEEGTKELEKQSKKLADNKKEEKKAEEEGKDGKQAKDQSETQAPQEIVLRVYMHCEGCARKVRRCLKGFEGCVCVAGLCLFLSTQRKFGSFFFFFFSSNSNLWLIEMSVPVLVRVCVWIFVRGGGNYNRLQDFEVGSERRKGRSSKCSPESSEEEPQAGPAHLSDPPTKA